MASNGSTKAINGRPEALRRNALEFRNLTHYRIRSLLHSGALHSLVRCELRRAAKRQAVAYEIELAQPAGHHQDCLASDDYGHDSPAARPDPIVQPQHDRLGLCWRR